MGDVIAVSHTMATRLKDVGLQVWNGSLLLCDYLLGNPLCCKDRCILELGAGVGLTSIVASMNASKVICTDIGNNVLSLCQANIIRNKHHRRKRLPGTDCSVKVCHLDWTEENNLTLLKPETSKFV